MSLAGFFVAFLLSFQAPSVGSQGITEAGINYFGLFSTGSLIPPLRGITNLVDNGGDIVFNPQVIQVFWGAGVPGRDYILNVKNALSGYYDQLVKSPYVEWLKEYTNKAGFSIGLSTEVGVSKYTITLSAAVENKTDITDQDVQNELVAQVKKGGLPAPVLGANGLTRTLYMISFPFGIKIQSKLLFKTCELICGYHGSFENGGHSYFYAVVPDMRTGLCPGGCGGNSSWQATRIVASHELVEILTDPRIQEILVPNVTLHPTPKITWYDLLQGEIADICLGKYGYFLNPKTGANLLAQYQWSNADAKCILTKYFTVTTASVLPIDLTIANSVRIIVTQKGLSTQSVTLSVTSKPTGTRVTFLPGNTPNATVQGSGNVTIQISARSTPPPPGAIVITGVGAASSAKLSLLYI